MLLFTCTRAYQLFKSRQQFPVKSEPQEEKTTPTFYLGPTLQSVRRAVQFSVFVGPTHSTTTTIPNKHTHATIWGDRMSLDGNNNKHKHNPVTARSVMCFRSNTFWLFPLRQKQKDTKIVSSKTKFSLFHAQITASIWSVSLFFPHQFLHFSTLLLSCKPCVPQFKKYILQCEAALPTVRVFLFFFVFVFNLVMGRLKEGNGDCEEDNDDRRVAKY